MKKKLIQYFLDIQPLNLASQQMYIMYGTTNDIISEGSGPGTLVPVKMDGWKLVKKGKTIDNYK